MVKKFLKIAGVKTEDEFYKKYPSESAFFKAHPEAKDLKKYKQGGQQKKLDQLTSYEGDIDNIIPIAQNGVDIWGNPLPITQMPINPNAGVGQMGLNNPAGGVLQLEPAAATANQITQTQMWGTGANVTQGGALGGITPNSIKGVASQKTTAPNILGKLGGIGGIVQSAGQIYQGIKEAKEEKKLLQESKQQKAVSDLTLQASQMRPERVKRKYVRPEDAMFQPDQLFPTYGVGTNYLAKYGATVFAQDGTKIGGNPTEIQNMYNPYNLFKDLGFEPLEDSEKIKQYYHGGGIPQAQSGFVQALGQYAKAGGADQAGQLFGGIGSAIGGSGFGQNAGSKIGGGVGKVAGTVIGGPIGGLVGSAVGSLAGGFIDQKGKKIAANQEATQQNLETAAFNSGAQTLQNQYSSFMKDGGYISHDWQPQVITTFGENKVSDLLRPDPTMDTLRTGGHITQNNMFPQDQYALGGELKTTWGGYAEPISHNPYMPGSGETVMFRGKSHDETNSNGQTGIGVKYGEGGKLTDYAEYGTENADADVEVERGEPATEMIDPETQDKNMVVYGNLKIPNQFLGEIGDPKAKGKKFKNYVANLAKQESKHNKTIEKNLKIIDDMDDVTSFDQMKFLSANANIDGANMKLKSIADKKMNAAAVQNAINEAAEEHGLDADSLAKGKFKIDKNAMNEAAKWGKSIKKAQDGALTKVEAMATVPPGQLKGDKYWGDVEQSDVDEMIKNNEWYFKQNPDFDPTDEDDIRHFQKSFNKEAKKLGVSARLHVDGHLGEQTVTAKGLYDNTPTTSTTPTPPAITVPTIPQTPPAEQKPPYHYPVTPYKRSGLMDVIGQGLQYLRPTNQEPLDPTQLYGEMYALATNQLDPVNAKLYHPLLEQPYDISLQDQLNANQADFNAMQRQTGYNPAASAALSSQKYAANSSVLGNQFRANQEMKAGVYNRNRGVLNDAQLKNLGILDQQMVRQATAKSRTKEVGQAALNSISDKIMKQKLANRTLGVYENLYNYRFDKKGRAINMNAPFQPNIPNVLPIYDNNGNIVGYQKQDDKTSSTSSSSTAPTISQQLAAVNAANTAQDQGYIPLPSIEDLYSTETVYPQQKKGGKTPARNRDILRAMKNL